MYTLYRLKAYFLLLVLVCTKAFPQAIGYTKIDIPASTFMLEKLVLLPPGNNDIVYRSRYYDLSTHDYITDHLHKSGVFTSITPLIFVLLLLCTIVGFYVYSNQNKVLRRANKNHELLFQIVAHDLRSPLNYYMGLTEIVNDLMKNKEYERLEKIGYEIEDASHKLESLLNNMLGWKFLPGYRKRSENEKIYIQDLLQEILPIYTLIATSRNITIHACIERNFVTSVDKNILSLIVRNFIDNAVKHSPAGTDIFICADSKKNNRLLSFKNEYKSEQKDRLQKMSALFSAKKTISSNQFTGSGLRFINAFTDIIKGHVDISFDEKFVTWVIALPS